MHEIESHVLDGVRGGVAGGVLRGLANLGGIETLRKAINAGVIAASLWSQPIGIKTIPEPKKVETPEPEKPTAPRGGTRPK